MPLRPWIRRVLLGGIAIGGSALYAASFVLMDMGTSFETIALAVAMAAGLAWIVFGAALLMVTNARPSVLAWADLCLTTMGIGIAALAVSVLLNLVGRGALSVHVAVLLVSNLAMGAFFVSR